MVKMTKDFIYRAFAAITVSAALLSLQGCAVLRGHGQAGADSENGGENVAEPAAQAETAQTEAAQPAPTPEPADDGKDDDGEIDSFESDESKVLADDRFQPLISRGYILRVAVSVGDNNEVGPLEVMVSENEDITLKYVGRVPCGGLTLPALHARLTALYSEFYKDPIVSIAFSYSEDGISPYGQVLVQGRVNREGWVNIPPTRNLRVSHAIQRCGGFSSSAIRSKVVITRKHEDGSVERKIVNFKEIGKKGALDKDYLLEPNDVVYVDESNF